MHSLDMHDVGFGILSVSFMIGSLQNEHMSTGFHFGPPSIPAPMSPATLRLKMWDGVTFFFSSLKAAPAS
jgi:hypothetical protein